MWLFRLTNVQEDPSTRLANACHAWLQPHASFSGGLGKALRHVERKLAWCVLYNAGGFRQNNFFFFWYENATTSQTGRAIEVGRMHRARGAGKKKKRSPFDTDQRLHTAHCRSSVDPVPMQDIILSKQFFLQSRQYVAKSSDWTMHSLRF